MLEVDEGAFGPELTAQVLARDDFAGLANQCEQDLERLILEPQVDAVLAQFTGAGVELDPFAAASQIAPQTPVANPNKTTSVVDMRPEGSGRFLVRRMNPSDSRSRAWLKALEAVATASGVRVKGSAQDGQGRLARLDLATDDGDWRTVTPDAARTA